VARGDYANAANPASQMSARPRALLAQFKLTQVLHIVGRDELKKELEG
jgi:hypothetical protein